MKFYKMLNFLYALALVLLAIVLVWVLYTGGAPK
jgi:hypothetical protein